MTESLIREIAKEIVQDQTASMWPYFVVLVGLMAVIGFFSALIGAYARRRGEHLATKADFDLLLAQLKATTSVTEQVRTQVSHTDWATRELRTLQRVKLEELLTSIIEVLNWQELARTHRLFGGALAPGPSPMPRAEAIAGLYFPELSGEFNAFSITYHEIDIATLNSQMAMLQAANDFEAKKRVLGEFTARWEELYPIQAQRVSALKTRARDVMARAIGA
jgi:hypothetical protein